MKAKNNIIIVAAAFLSMLLTAGCQKSQVSDPKSTAENKVNLLSGIMEGKETKTHLGPLDSSNNIYSNLWSEGDRIAVYVDDIATPDAYTIVSGQNTSSATFSGRIKGGRYVALYPYSFAKELKGSTLGIELPSKQQYTAGSFSNDSYPMIAVSDNTRLTFRNLCGIVRLSLTGNQLIRSIVLKANDASKKVSGPATVATDYSGDPSLTMGADGSDQVVLECSDSVLLNPDNATEFDIVVPAQTYVGGITIRINTIAGYAEKKIASDVVIARSGISPIRPYTLKLDVGTEPSSSLEGKGDEESPFLIKSASDLLFMQMAVNTDRTFMIDSWNNRKFSVAQYRLTEDIDLSNTCNAELGSWVPIGKVYGETFHYFSGTFDGGGHTISGLYIKYDLSDKDHIDLGLFGRSNGTIKNLTLDGKVEGGGSFIGGIVGYGRVMENCHNRADVSGRQLTGGVAGEAMTVVACSNEGRISGYIEVGGVTGNAWVSAIDCHNSGDVHGDYWTGGIVGDVDGNGIIYNGYNIGNVVSKEGESGGIVGKIQNSASLKNCYNTGSVTFTDPNGRFTSLLGGICGGNYAGCTITNCYWLYDAQQSLGIEKGIGGGDGSASDNFALTDAMMKGTPTAYPLYVYGDGTSYDTLSDALTAWAAENSVTGYDLYGWTFEPGSYPVLTDKAATKPEGGSSTTFMVSPTVIKVKDIGDTISVKVTANIGYSITSMPEWITEITPASLPGFRAPSTTKVHTFVVERNTGTEERSGAISFCGDNSRCVSVNIIQQGMKYYSSADYSIDGKVTKLQTHTSGNGIAIVLMGDAFVDLDFADGTFDATMAKAMDYFFTVEPYKSLRERFDVYSVAVVSKNREYESDAERAFNTQFGTGTFISGDDQKVFSYAKKIAGIDLTKSLVIVALNSTRFAGMCYLYNDNSAIAYLPVGPAGSSNFETLIHHEAGGHGFGKLLDEYQDNAGTIPDKDKSDFMYKRDNYGWGANVDVTNDPATIRWAKFLTNDLYKDQVGIYEGALTYEFGAWRPTVNSVMRYNAGEFNAPSREAIYKRILELSGEEFSWDKFVSYDAINRSAATTSALKAPALSARAGLEPLGAPVFVNRTWQEAVGTK